MYQVSGVKLMRPGALATLVELIPAEHSGCRDALPGVKCQVLCAMYYVNETFVVRSNTIWSN